jgi:threonine dehydratase
MRTDEGVARVTLADIEAAAKLLYGVIKVTPLESSRWLSDTIGGPAYLKCENLQRCGSFKIRGAYVRMSRLTEVERRAGVVAASAGNHAQGVALAAALLGIHATVFMPHGAPIPKEKATRGYGADIRFVGDNLDQALVAAREFQEETGAVLIHPYDHEDIVSGQGTLGLEVASQCPDVKTVVIATGGGGLTAGSAIALKALCPGVRVIGVQAETAAAYPASLAAGRPIQVAEMATMADGIAVGLPGVIPFAAIQQNVDEMRTVSEESLSTALLLLLERAKLVVEPAGAAAVAALLDAPRDFEPPVVAVLSGGNVDPLLLMRIVRHGLAAAGRYLSFRARIPDRPGALARLLTQLGDLQVNVLDVVHSRTSAELHLDEVEVELQVETRGTPHAEEVIEKLRKAGYPLSFLNEDFR